MSQTAEDWIDIKESVEQKEKTKNSLRIFGVYLVKGIRRENVLKGQNVMRSWWFPSTGSLKAEFN